MMIADPQEEGRNRLAAAVDSMRAVSLGLCVSSLTEVYHAAESRPPQVVIVAEELARLPEFEVLLTLFKALSIRCVVIADSHASVQRLSSAMTGPDVAITHRGVSDGELRESLLQVHLGRGAKQAPQAHPKSGLSFQTGKIILIGASTGGVDALINVLDCFPVNCPPTLIVQHTSGTFSSGLARLLDRNTAARVVEAEDRQMLTAGTVLLAPGKEHHLEVGAGKGLHCRLREGPLRSGHRPSVDALFESAVSIAPRVTAAILTGMGRDGAEGLLALRKAGAHTIGQNKATSLVYGMPRAAYELGAVASQLPLDAIGEAILDNCSRRSAA
ncbi:Chemotaxis response regulator protein-glutamate methylesterase CheB [Rhodovulum sp. P5]|nr:Chemotaxis response regulator protein-glutamate methylesterase CheB [Rhodovulum sp. P5]